MEDKISKQSWNSDADQDSYLSITTDYQFEKSKEEGTPNNNKATLAQLYQFLEPKQKVILYFGGLAAIVGGSSNIIINFAISRIITDLNYEHSRTEQADSIRDGLIWILISTFIYLITSTIYYTTFDIVYSKVAYEFQWRYLLSVLRQDTSWFDSHNPQELPSKIGAECSEIGQAAGHKMGVTLNFTSSLTMGIIISLYCGWLLAIICIWIHFVLLIFGLIQNQIAEKSFVDAEHWYMNSASKWQEALVGIKVVKAFGQERKEEIEYRKYIDKGKTLIRSNIKSYSWVSAAIQSYLLINYVLCFYIGGIMVLEKVENHLFNRDYKAGDLYGCFYWISWGIYWLAHSFLNIEVINKGRISAHNALSIINRKPLIDINFEGNERVTHIQSDIFFENVSFTYHGRNKEALSNLNIKIETSKVTALVGESGSGKSTVVKLLQRFYDPQQGAITVGGKELSTINLRDYRRCIGYVGQEPWLFNESIEDNIRNAKPDATDDEIDQALRDAMAYDFVMQLPDQKKTNVGSLGLKISGGQKQRIAIARALIRKPDLLILDEATSALDRNNELSVQKVMKHIQNTFNITIVVIAHKLSTIKDADKIYVMNQGSAVEEGNHNSLILNRQIYVNYYESQKQIEEKENMSCKHLFSEFWLFFC